MVSSGINDVVIASVLTEKIYLKKLMVMIIIIIIIIIIMNRLQETMVVSSHQKLTSAIKLRPEKVRVDIKFDALQVSLHRELLGVKLVENLSGNLY